MTKSDTHFGRTDEYHRSASLLLSCHVMILQNLCTSLFNELLFLKFLIQWLTIVIVNNSPSVQIPKIFSSLLRILSINVSQKNSSLLHVYSMCQVLIGICLTKVQVLKTSQLKRKFAIGVKKKGNGETSNSLCMYRAFQDCSALYPLSHLILHNNHMKQVLF